MTPRRALVLLLAVAVAATCVRLGLWQLSRRAQKHAIQAVREAAFAAAPLELTDSLPAIAPSEGQRVRLHGAWDDTLHVLLSGRTNLGAAGVTLVSALRLASGEAVLVERGWLPAADGRSTRLDGVPTADSVVLGVVQRLPDDARSPVWVALEPDRAGPRIWSARSLTSGAATAHVGRVARAWYVLALPDSQAGRASGPIAANSTNAPSPRAWSEPGETMHLSYALQWFAFAAIALIGGSALAFRRR